MNINLIKDLFSKKYVKRNYEGFPIYLRNNLVDNQVYEYVFGDKYHRPFKLIDIPAPVILDLGVNIGLSVVDFKFLYPNAVIYGYELDSRNTELALKNTSAFSDVHIFNRAVWNKNGLVGKSGTNADAYKIDDGIANQESFVGTTTINEIVSDNNLYSIDFVKMDIEGAEFEVMKEQTDWLKITKQIKIEIHHGKEVFDLISEKLISYGFTTIKDNHHWSTLIGFKNAG